MFHNDKLVKKLKTPLSIRMMWDENQTLTFDLPENSYQNVCFMVVLSFKLQNSSSPVSPESPDAPPPADHASRSLNSPRRSIDGNGGEGSAATKPVAQSTSRKNSSNARKECIIGHFVLDRATWMEDILIHPRKQILKWHKIY